MLCQRCSQNPAAIHVQQNINGKKTQVHLCQSCYKSLGGSAPGEFGWASLFGGMEGSINGFGYPQLKKLPKCEMCGLTYEKFISGGKFGCASCYGEFNDKLEQMFKRLHGSSVHQGRLPGNIDKPVKKPERPQKKLTTEQIERAVGQTEHMKAETAEDGIESQIAELKQGMAKAVKEEELSLIHI